MCIRDSIGIDLYRGLADGVFSLVRGKPITAADGFGYRLLVFGESLAVIAMLGCAALMLKLYSLFRSMPRDARPTNSSGDH